MTVPMTVPMTVHTTAGFQELERDTLIDSISSNQVLNLRLEKGSELTWAEVDANYAPTIDYWKTYNIYSMNVNIPDLVIDDDWEQLYKIPFYTMDSDFVNYIVENIGNVENIDSQINPDGQNNPDAILINDLIIDVRYSNLDTEPRFNNTPDYITSRYNLLVYINGDLSDPYAIVACELEDNMNVITFGKNRASFFKVIAKLDVVASLWNFSIITNNPNIEAIYFKIEPQPFLLNGSFIQDTVKTVVLPA